MRIDYQALALLHLQCGSILLGAAVLLLEEESVSPSFDDNMVDEMINVATVDLGLEDHLREGRKRQSRDTNQDGTPIKKRMINYNRKRAYRCIMEDYLDQEAKFNDRQFEHHFRITKGLFEFILQEFVNDDPSFWMQTKDCCGRFTTFLAALRLVSYDISW